MYYCLSGLLDLKSSILRKVSACPWGPKAVVFRFAKLPLEALEVTMCNYCQGDQVITDCITVSG